MAGEEVGRWQQRRGAFGLAPRRREGAMAAAEAAAAPVAIAVIGPGSVGGTLARRWLAAGHKVVLGARDPTAERVRLLVNQLGAGVRALPPAEAAAEAEVVVLATPWARTEAAVAACGELAGKILVDCTNPLSEDFQSLAVGHDRSGAELVAGWAGPGARVVKAFNCVGFNIMADPALADGPASMPVCGDDPQARAVVMGLAADIGFEPVDAGPLREARLLEPLALLWIRLSLAHGLGRDWAFRVARR
jgi:hypothetical protein